MSSPAKIATAGITPEEIQRELLLWDDDKGRVVIIVTTLFTACAAIATVARLITRRAINKIAWQLDDYAIVLATVRTCLLPH